MTSPADDLNQSREDLIYRFSHGEMWEDFQEQYTEAVDQYFRKGLQESSAGRQLFRKKRPFALVAVGGYGRRELCIHSDVDIMILFGSTIPKLAKDLSDDLFLPLWDLGLDVGHGIRTIKDCVSLGRSDFEVLTSLMDARFLGGDSPLYLSLVNALQKKVVAKRATAFGRWVQEVDQIRMETQGDATYLLEPHLKEGIGGLRDYHHMLWLAKAFSDFSAPKDLEYLGMLTQKEYEGLHEDLRFMWVVRNHLHLLSGRKNDRLSFAYQEEIATRLGFQDRKGSRGVEQFLGRLHASMAAVKFLHRHFMASVIPDGRHRRPTQKDPVNTPGLSMGRGELNFDSATAILSNPLLVMEIFRVCSHTGYPLSMEAMRLVREFSFLVDEEFRAREPAVQGFLDILKGAHLSLALDALYETGILGAFLPEFDQVKDRVQFDAYHLYPVGRHSLETVKHLKALSAQKDVLLLDVFSELKRPETLFLAGLFHDMGKIGSDHARRGVGITRGILERFGYDRDRTEDILFLVGHHLLLAETATRRDLNDEKTVVHCARSMGTVDRLKMLYLLTWADSKATGPRAWNEWISNLVQELFFKILHILEKGELASPHASETVEQTQKVVRHLVDGKITREELDRFFDVMSPRYILNTSPRDMERHLKGIHRLKNRPVDPDAAPFHFKAAEVEPDGCWELTFAGTDRPGLFSDLAGVLALGSINILSADIYTWRDGTAVDIFKVTGPLDPLHPQETWKKVTQDLRETFSGNLHLDRRLEQKAAPSVLSTSTPPSRPPKVVVDNVSSDFFTVIEVFADDRLGLLYRITRALFRLGLNIRVAKIATRGDQAADVFYVRDLEGQKLDDEAQVAATQRALIEELGRI
jgi:[protein-PII] uridylyltransferase